MKIQNKKQLGYSSVLGQLLNILDALGYILSMAYKSEIKFKSMLHGFLKHIF